MIKKISINQTKMGKWNLSLECSILMGGLSLLALKKCSVHEKQNSLFYKTSEAMLIEEFPGMKSIENILSNMKILESKKLILLKIDDSSINYMFTNKGAQILIYKLPNC